MQAKKDALEHSVHFFCFIDNVSPSSYNITPHFEKIWDNQTRLFMLYFLLFLFTFNIYSASVTQDQKDMMKDIPLSEASLKATFGVRVYQGQECGFEYTQTYIDDITALQLVGCISNHRRAVAYRANAIIYDKCGDTYKNLKTAHLSEAAEQLFCKGAMEFLSRYPDELSCICTTLESSASLIQRAQADNRRINVVVAGADNTYDFSQILEENKDKRTFVFIAAIAESLLPEAEFLLQLQRSHAMQASAGNDVDEDKVTVIFLSAIQQSHGDFSVGDLHYGTGGGRIAHRRYPNFYRRLAQRATQAERLNAELPCDKAFLISSEYKEKYTFWKEFIEQHVSLIHVREFDDTVFSSQTPGNVFVRNNPPKDLSSRLHHQRAGVDVLIGSPERGICYSDGPIVWGCGVRVFHQLIKEGFDARCVFASNEHLRYTPPQLTTPLKNRSLICAGPEALEGCMINWAAEFAANAYEKVIFIPCDTFPQPSEYRHVLGGDLLYCDGRSDMLYRRGHAMPLT